jgi:pseudaminic acid synthase
MKKKTIKIDGKLIGDQQKPYVIAELSGNHNGDINRCFRIIEEAKRAGADAVKLQTYRPDTITINHHGPEFMIKGGLWDGRRLYELYEEAHTPWEWHPALFEFARKIGITIFSSPFDNTAVDFLEGLDAPAYKIASPEIVDIPLICRVARTGKPVIMSTGAASFTEIHDAVSAATESGASQIALLVCTAAYPAPPNEVNLATIADLVQRFDLVVGLSDHTTGNTVAIAAAALGAMLIEKHFTLARSDGGVDSVFSVEPSELGELVTALQVVHEAVGRPTYGPTPSEGNVVKHRRSLYVVKPIAKGDRFTIDNVRSIRPANGIAPKYLSAILGKTAARDLSFGEPFALDMIAD